MPRKTTKQQAKFIEAMANPKTKNNTEAAIMAGCPPKNARITASKWLTNSNIIEEIEDRKQRAIAHSDVSLREVFGSAVFQMRSSMDDVLDENGEFDIQKARETGAIDLVKDLQIKTVIDAKTGDQTITHKVKMLSNQDGRKEVAEYLESGSEISKHLAESQKESDNLFKTICNLIDAYASFQNLTPSEGATVWFDRYNQRKAEKEAGTMREGLICPDYSAELLQSLTDKYLTN